MYEIINKTQRVVRKNTEIFRHSRMDVIWLFIGSDGGAVGRLLLGKRAHRLGGQRMRYRKWLWNDDEAAAAG